MGNSKEKPGSGELFKWDGNPSAGQIAPLAIQHVLAAVVGCVTPAILVANAANNAGGSVDILDYLSRCHWYSPHCLHCYNYMEIK